MTLPGYPFAYAIFFWVFFLIYTVFLFVLLNLCKLYYTIARKENFDLLCHNFAAIWSRGIIATGRGWKVEYKGRENIDTLGNKPCVIVCNHESNADIWVISCLNMQFRWLSKDEVFKLPIIGSAMRWAGYIPIKRGDKQSHAEALLASGRVLRRGVSMLFFPEGTRSKTGIMGEFKVGAFKLASDNRVEILPIVLSGTGDLLPKGSAIPAPADVKVRILEPVNPKEGEDLHALMARVRTLMLIAKEKMGD